MLRLIATIFALLMTAPLAYAQNVAYQNHCTVGGQKVMTQGLQSTTQVLASYPNCTVTVYESGTTNLATIYSNSAGAPLSNPFTANSNAGFIFYASLSSYPLDVTISGAGMPAPYTFSDVQAGTSAPITGTPYAVPYFPSSGNGVSSSQVTVDSTGVNLTVPGVDKVVSLVEKGPKVNVVWFGADPTGVNDSTSAINSAISYIASVPASTNRPVLYFPAGTYTVGTGNTGYTALFTLPTGSVVEGDSAASSVINSKATHADTFFYTPAAGSTCLSGTFCFEVLRNLTLNGIGHLGNNTGVEVLNQIDFFATHVLIENFGGIGISFQGSTERSRLDDVDIAANNRALVLEGDTNENYFDRVNAINNGTDAGGWCYSRKNCTAGAVNSGTHYPDFTPAVQLDGSNIHWSNSSVKATWPMAGIRIASGDAITIEHTYVEGFVSGFANPGIQVIGAGEIGHTTAAITTTALTIPVDDAIYQPLYLADPNTLSQLSTHSYVNSYTIFPPDYLAGDTTDLSSICAGVSGCNIYRGTAETVSVNAFSADGNGHLFSRGTTAYAWPSGAVIEQVSISNYGNIEIDNSHLESVEPNSSNTPGCSDTAQLTTWKGNPSELCSEIIGGPVPDGFQVPFPSSTSYDSSTANFLLRGNSFYFGSGEGTGQGYIKIPGSASVTINNSIGLLESYPAASALFSNPSDRVVYVQWPGATALGAYSDSGFGIFGNPSGGYYEQKTYINQPGNILNVQEQMFSGAKCIDPIPATGTQPTYRTCNGPTGWYLQYYNSATSSWVNSFSVSSAGALEVVGYNTSSSYTIPISELYLWENTAGSSTVTLPPMASGARLTVFYANGSGTGLQFISPSNSIYVNGSSVGTTYSITTKGAYVFELDGAEYQLIQAPTSGTPAAIRSGTGTISASTTAAITFATAMTSTPSSCAINPSSSSATTGQPYATGFTTTGFTANVPTSGTINFTYQCVVNNSN